MEHDFNKYIENILLPQNVKLSTNASMPILSRTNDVIFEFQTNRLKLSKFYPIEHSEFKDIENYNGYIMDYFEAEIHDILAPFNDIITENDKLIERESIYECDQEVLDVYGIKSIAMFLSSKPPFSHEHDFYKNLIDTHFADYFTSLHTSYKLTKKSYEGMIEALGIDISVVENEFEKFNNIFDNSISYHCNSVIDVTLATLDFITMKGLRLSKCPHCGKFFIAESPNEKYCNNSSPIYSNKTCKQAVKYMKMLDKQKEDKFRLEKKEAKKVYNRLRSRAMRGKDEKSISKLTERYNTFTIEKDEKLEEIESRYYNIPRIL